MKELEKNYDPKQVEERIYSNWLEKKYFHAKVDKSKEPFTIVIPPPNVTGQLHMGHALDNTLQDIMIRFKKMQGFETLWVPGTDHASISTEVKVVEKLLKEGIKKEDLGREKFLEKAWEWKEEYGGKILSQLRKLGCSLDWDRTRFTMDEGLSNAVLEVFVRLYEKGLIYRGEKIINWCPHCKTTISDAEVQHEEKQGNFYHILYPIKGTNEHLEVATTRPETMLGDTALAVHPDDERYKNLVGKTVILPILNKEIPVVADEYVDMEFGTGVVKITPAHDPNDFEVGQRHNLPIITVMNDDGTMNKNGGKYEGKDRYEARKEIVEELKQLGLLVKIKEHDHNVGTHERCNQVIEPMVKKQWFVKMEELAKPAIDAYKENELRFIPDRYGKVYLNWLDNIHDWCISRQLWWGHRIPAYYCEKCGHIVVSKAMPSACEKCGDTHFNQDEDVLDTWFSSALWPFSTLGWPDGEAEDFKYFYPTNVLVTGYDIIFFWVVRMVFSALEHTNTLPFKDVLMHGLVRDSQGRKMSKSLGNGIDPLEVIEQYGTDSLRLTLISSNSPGNDMRFYYERVEASRNFANKVWNATRFLMMNIEDKQIDRELSDEIKNSLISSDKWILSKLNTIKKEVTENMEKYDFGVAVQKVYDFIWDEYCDWYIEMVKPRLYNKEDKTRDAALWTLKTVLIDSLKLLHPYMPFITEEIFTNIQDEEESIMLSKWPKFNTNFVFEKEEKEIEMMKEAVKNIRNIRAEMNIIPSKKVKIFAVSESAEIREVFEKEKSCFSTLASASELAIQQDKTGIEPNAISVVINGGVIYIPFSDLVDVDKEIERLEKEEAKFIEEVERIDKKLNNEGFVSKAPQAVIDGEKEKRENYNSKLAEVRKRIQEMKSM